MCLRNHLYYFSYFCYSPTSNDTLDFDSIARVNSQVLTNGRAMTSVLHQSEIVAILVKGWNVYREGVPVLPGTLLDCPRPERVTLSLLEGTLKHLENLAAEGAGHDPASALKDAADYKSAPLPIRGNPPLSKSRCASKASVKLEAGPESNRHGNPC